MMRGKGYLSIICCLIFLSILCTGAGGGELPGAGKGPSAGVVINFHNRCKTENESVTIGDIASVSCDDPRLCEKIRNIYVATLASPGTTLNISADQVADILRKNLPNLGVSLAGVRGTVPVEIVVTRVRGSKIRNIYAGIYKDYVLSHMPWAKTDVTISDIRVGSTTIVPGKNGVTYRVVADSSLSFLGNTPLSIVMFRNGDRIGSVRVVGKVNVFKKVAKAARGIKSHEVFTQNDVRFVKENIAELPHDVITDSGDIMGKESVRSFRVNEIIRKRDVAQPLLVQKGDVVTILISAPGLLITSKGQALEGGRLGQMMRVKNIATKRIVIGMVKGHKTVQVAF